MRIKKIALKSRDVESRGLSEFSSTRLNDTLALVGKNGSGKTRYLKAIEEKLRNFTLADLIESEFEFLPLEIQPIIKDTRKELSAFKVYDEYNDAELVRKNNPESEEAVENFRKIQRKLNGVVATTATKPNNYFQLNKEIKKVLKSRIKVILPDDFRKLKKTLDNQSGQTTFQNILDSNSEDSYSDLDEFSMITDSALSFLRKLPHKLAYDELSTKGDQAKFRNRVSYKRFILLKDLIKEFLGKTLNWESKELDISEDEDFFTAKTRGFWILDNKVFDYALLSDGEKVLFTYALLLFLLSTNSQVKFKESIIIIDEPELNLHPKAQIQLIESLQDLIKDQGQLIIATHSLSIVANLHYGSIHLVKNGKLYSPSSTIPFESVDELMGFEEHYYRISDFLSSTPTWAMINFMGECFESPEVFEHANENDPQLEILKNLLHKQKGIKLLDFGSGKGRLLERLKESQEASRRIKLYDCLDPETKYNDRVVKLGANKVYNDLENTPVNYYDLVVLVNVLHEIPILEWEESINRIKQILKPEGFLAIIEDVELPIGELPNKHGFLLLDKEEMRILLGQKTFFFNSPMERYKNRIICAAIDGQSLNIVNNRILIQTLKRLKENSLNSIKEYREISKPNVKLGRLFALKSNLYVNSEIAMNLLQV